MAVDWEDRVDFERLRRERREILRCAQNDTASRCFRKHEAAAHKAIGLPQALQGGSFHLPQAFPQSSRAAAKTCCSLGTVASSSGGEKGIGTFIAPIRFTR